MKKVYSLFLGLALAGSIGYGQSVCVLASPTESVFDANSLAIEEIIGDAWAGVTTELVDVAGIGDWDEATWAQYDAIVMTESGGSASHGKISPIGIKTCPIVSMKAYAIKRTYPQWNLIKQSAGTWFQQTKDSSQVNYDYTYSGVVVEDHPIFGGFWETGEEFVWTTSYNENMGDEAHIQCFDLDSSSAPVAAAATCIATNKFAADETGSAVDGWLWAMDEVADSSYKKTVIWGIHHQFLDNVTDDFGLILQNALAWVLDHEIPNVWVNGISDSRVNNFGLRTFPNPADVSANVQFTTATLSNVDMIISDLAGRVVYQDSFTSVLGTQNVAVSTSDWASGMYTIQLMIGGQLQTQLLVVN